MKEHTPEERYGLVKKAFPKDMKLTKKIERDLEEVLYTAHEAGALNGRPNADEALLIWQFVELAKTGAVTPEMKL